MKDFLSLEFLATATAVVALLFSIISSVISILEKRKREKENTLNTQDSNPLIFRVNGKNIKVNGKDKDVLGKVLDIKGGEIIFIDRMDSESDKKIIR
jgi:hypothetical protein